MASTPHRFNDHSPDAAEARRSLERVAACAEAADATADAAKAAYALAAGLGGPTTASAAAVAATRLGDAFRRLTRAFDRLGDVARDDPAFRFRQLGRDYIEDVTEGDDADHHDGPPTFDDRGRPITDRWGRLADDPHFGIPDLDDTDYDICAHDTTAHTRRSPTPHTTSDDHHDHLDHDDPPGPRYIPGHAGPPERHRNI
jgi:hypothetical protein